PKAIAVASPMPELAPVTRAFWPRNSGRVSTGGAPVRGPDDGPEEGPAEPGISLPLGELMGLRSSVPRPCEAGSTVAKLAPLDGPPHRGQDSCPYEVPCGSRRKVKREVGARPTLPPQR